MNKPAAAVSHPPAATVAVALFMNKPAATVSHPPQPQSVTHPQPLWLWLLFMNKIHFFLNFNPLIKEMIKEMALIQE